MRCIANVYLKQKAKCILKNVDILIQKEDYPAYKDLEEFEICVDKFYGDFILGNRNIDVALQEYTDIFEKYDVDSIVPKRMLLLIFENVVDYLDIIDNQEMFHWYYLIAKLILVNMLVEEFSNSLTKENLEYDDMVHMLETNNETIFDDEVSELFDKNYLKLIKNIVRNQKATKKSLNELSKSPLDVNYDIVGEFNGIVYYISKIKFDETIFKGIDINHAFDAFQKYGYATDFKFIEAENISFEIIKNVFNNKIKTLYFVKLPYDFLRLKTNIEKMVKIIEPKTLKHFIFLVPYEEIIDRTNKVLEMKKCGFKVGVYNMKTVESKSLKLKNIVDYVFIKTEEMINYEGVVKFARSLNSIIVENERNSYKIYK